MQTTHKHFQETYMLPCTETSSTYFFQMTITFQGTYQITAYSIHVAKLTRRLQLPTSSLVVYPWVHSIVELEFLSTFHLI
jgi:hypothetical protein